MPTDDQLKNSLTTLHLFLRGNDIELTAEDRFLLDDFALEKIHEIDLKKKEEEERKEERKD